jgi:sugar lactone lactonase YvrE
VWRRLVFVTVLALVLTAGLPATAKNKQSFPDVFNVPNGWQPEGIAVGRGTSFYVGSLFNGAVYGGDLRTGEGAIVVPAQTDGRIAVGLDVDERSNAIFVAGGGPAIGLPIPGSGYVYDADTGAELANYSFNGLFVNDVIVTKDAAYFTDSLRPVLYKVPLGPGGSLPASFEEIPLSGDFVQGGFPSANGIVATPNGKTLILAHTEAASLYKVDPDTGVATEIDLGGAFVPSADGLVLAGKQLYVVQNFLNRIGVVHLDSSLTSGVVGEPLTSPDYMIPTTADRFGNKIYAVNARFGEFTPGVPSPNLEFTVVGLPAR